MDLTLNATLQAVSQFSQQLEAHLDHLAIVLRTSIVLAVQELMVNIVQHAYADVSGQIKFSLSQADGRITINVVDQAPRGFDLPETIPEPDPLDLPENGMGLFIIYQSFDAVNYKMLLANSKRD